MKVLCIFFAFAVLFVGTHAQYDEKWERPIANVLAGSLYLDYLVEQFKSDLKSSNTIAWDAVPEDASAPNPLPPDFFRRVGTIFVHPDADGEFNVFTPGAAIGKLPDTSAFETFSSPKLFTVLESNIMAIDFVVPDTEKRAVSNGFGAIFSGVNIIGSTVIDMWDQHCRHLGTFAVPIGDEHSGLSFLGISWLGKTRISRVHITIGTDPIGYTTESDKVDIVVMDDFIFGIPTEFKFSSLCAFGCKAPPKEEPTYAPTYAPEPTYDPSD